jgi:hypothetical protein
VGVDMFSEESQTSQALEVQYLSFQHLAEAGGPWVQSQPVLYSETLSQKKKKVGEGGWGESQILQAQSHIRIDYVIYGAQFETKTWGLLIKND